MNIQYTSGTTGFPKGAMTTHEYWIITGVFAGDLMRGDDMFLSLRPFYYMDTQWTLLACLHAGCTMVITNKLTADNFVRCVKTYPITWSWGREMLLNIPYFKTNKDHLWGHWH